ncbi:MAG: hypothetical protein JOZ69_23600 [Myxococcales bacterium]|nr:hypothetical protein [Myxococcales bacterium]
MKLHRIASLAAIAALPAILHCEPLDAGAAPATPHAAPPTETPPRAPGPSTAAGVSPSEAEEKATGESEAANPDGRYASGEYALGADNGADSYDDDDPAALTDFHAALDSHGTWADDPTYGTVWTPAPAEVGPDFSPYVSDGHWAYDDDWVWVSDHEWGWAPFHYGRWVFIEGRGWCWIPGRVYRGAWVQWGVDDGFGYVGWAPLPPSFVWFGGIAVVLPIYVGPRWTYCPRGDVFAPGLRGHVLAGSAAAPVAARVRPYVAASPGVVGSGPAPQRLGFQAAQIPHATGPAAVTVARAREFARPASAAALGGRPPTHLNIERSAPMSTESALPASRLPARIAAPTAPQAPNRAPAVVQTPSRAPAVAPAPVRAPVSSPSRGPAAPVAPHNVAPPAAAPRPFHSAPTFHVGGGRHH